MKLSDDEFEALLMIYAVWSPFNLVLDELLDQESIYRGYDNWLTAYRESILGSTE